MAGDGAGGWGAVSAGASSAPVPSLTGESTEPASSSPSCIAASQLAERDAVAVDIEHGSPASTAGLMRETPGVELPHEVVDSDMRARTKPELCEMLDDLADFAEAKDILGPLGLWLAHPSSRRLSARLPPAV